MYEQFDQRDEILFLTHTVEPEHDSLAMLQRFSANLNLPDKQKHWRFLTGEKEVLIDHALKGYKIPLDETPQQSLANSAYLVLVDTSSTIRYYYDARKKDDMEKLIEHISLTLPQSPARDFYIRRETEK